MNDNCLMPQDEQYITPEQQAEILKQYGEGISLKKLCRTIGISWTTLAELIRTDTLFSTQWDLARIRGADILSDELGTMYDDAQTMVEAVVAKGKSDNLRTIVGWRNPAKFGPKLNVDVTHSVDLSKALQQAEHRAIPILEQAQIDRGYGAMQDVPPVDKVAYAPSQLGASSTIHDAKMQEKQALKRIARDRAEKDNAILVDVDPIEPVSDFDKYL